MVKNLPASTGDRIRPLVWEDPTSAEQLSPCATTVEPVL